MKFKDFIKQKIKKKFFPGWIRLENRTLRLENELSNKDFNIINSIWRTWGSTDLLLKTMEFYAESSFLWERINNHLWLIYISALYEKRMIDKAEAILMKYLHYYGKEDIERYLLASVFSQSIGVSNIEIEKAAFIHKLLKENRRKNLLGEIIQNAESIAIVGNGPSEMGKRKGREIDNHDVVIRFNNYAIKNFEEDYGTKVDIWIRGSGGSDVIDRGADSSNIYKMIMWEADYDHFPIHHNHGDILYRDLLLDPNRSANFGFKTHLSLRQKSLITFPTTGLVALWGIYNILGEQFNKVNIYGFSFLQDNPDEYATHYFQDRGEDEGRRRSSVHHLDRETEFILSIIKGAIK